MSPFFNNHPQFHPNQNAISIADHPPEIAPGTAATIVCPWIGTLYAVQTPDGEFHRWFAWFELAPVDPPPSSLEPYDPGSYAAVISNFGHGEPPHIALGTVVRIVKCIPQTIFYDVRINGNHYHRWLAEFEIAAPLG